MATCGPWLEPTPWPAVWWNLNIQLEYWLIHGSNHLELDSLTSTLRQNQEQLIANVPAAYRADSAGVGRSSDMFANRGVPVPGSGGEAGNLTWALHNVWLSYRHSMDEDLLRDTVYPLLRRAINYYLHFLQPGDDGKLHLPSTLSPEYPVVPPKDTNYDLALIRWGCGTLLEASERLGVDDPLVPRWQEVLARLTPYPVDDNGFMIGADTPYAQSHRHYSHLLMVYPLYLVNWEQPEQRELIEKSVVHWHALTGSHRGYSYTGRRVAVRDDGPRRHRALVPEEVLRHQHALPVPGQHPLHRGRAGHRDTAVGVPVPARHALPELGRRRPGLSRRAGLLGAMSPCTTSAPRAPSWSARSAAAASHASYACGAWRASRCGSGTV